MLDELMSFFHTIKENAPNYAVVSVKANRCFSLLWRYDPTIEHMLTNNAALLQYRKLADQYQQSGRFPRILIVDDIMIHGRGVSKFLVQLEQLVYEELEARGHFQDENDRLAFRHSFADALDIYIYACSRGTLFLEDRFFRCIKAQKTLYAGQLRDLSLQLSALLIQWETANTSFVCSIRNKELAQFLLNETEPRGDWKKISWNYKEEQMQVYLRFYGEPHINRILTIRFFANRAHVDEPQITSFTVLGTLDRSTLDNICEKLYDCFQQKHYPLLCRILREEKESLQYCKAQLIDFLCSVTDLFEFLSCRPLHLQKDGKELTFWEAVRKLFRYDLKKIVRNFSDEKESIREFSAIIADPELQKQISIILTDGFSAPECRLFLCPQEECSSQNTHNTYTQTDINDFVGDILQRIGAEAESQAQELNNRPYLFAAKEFQEYSTETGGYGKDGVISFQDFLHNLDGIGIVQKLDDFYPPIASYIMMMDCGFVGSRLYYSSKEKKVLSVLKTGAIATYHMPACISLYIPAFALIEENAYRIGMPIEEALVSFSRMRSSKELQDAGLSQEEISRWKKTYPNGEEEETLIRLRKDYQLLLRCGQSFNGWNFPHLTLPSEANKKMYQKQIVREATRFLNMY